VIRTARSGSQRDKSELVDTLDYMAFEALNEMDGYAVLAMGRTETLGCYCPVNDLLRNTIEVLSRSFDTILVDGEAGLEQINRQVMRGVDTLVVVTDPTSRGLETASLIRRMVEVDKVIQCRKLGLVFNRFQGNKELLEQSARDIGLEILGYVPQDEKIAQHDLVGKPLTELPADSIGLDAVRDIVERHIL
jgi:CO dehydrogenase maturation factor